MLEWRVKRSGGGEGKGTGWQWAYYVNGRQMCVTSGACWGRESS